MKIADSELDFPLIPQVAITTWKQVHIFFPKFSLCCKICQLSNLKGCIIKAQRGIPWKKPEIDKLC